MSETKDQTIARLEGELAASREKMECGHPKVCWREADTLCENCGEGQSQHAYYFTGRADPKARCNNFKGDDRNAIPALCTICAELATTRAAASKYPRPCGLCPGMIESSEDTEWHGLGNCVPICESCNGSGTSDAAELAATRAECYKLAACVCENWNEHTTGSPADLIRSLVTPSDAAAREDWIRRIRLEEHYTWPDPPINSTDWIDWARHCRELSKRDSARVAELRAPVPAARAEDANELRYCGRCNQRRYFKDGKCEMCALQDSRDRRINAEDGDHYETARAGDAVCGTCGAGWGDGKNGHPNCPDCHGTGRASK